MNITELIKKNFNSVIESYFEEEFGNKFLRVCIDETDLGKLAKISSEINKYVDEVDKTDDAYFLDIFSPGTDKTFDVDKSQDYINKNVRVFLKSRVKTFLTFEGELITVEDETLTIRWNDKGQFRKQQLEFNNIEKIETYIKAKRKEKKWTKK
ncbi:MAG: hypothetical protein KAG14_00500 [Mycoplasmataceae bacterium]|nr:hypothetical protein [Mycoplasmataceae bacterium]